MGQTAKMCGMPRANESEPIIAPLLAAIQHFACHGLGDTP